MQLLEVIAVGSLERFTVPLHDRVELFLHLVQVFFLTHDGFSAHFPSDWVAFLSSSIFFATSSSLPRTNSALRVSSAIRSDACAVESTIFSRKPSRPAFASA